MSDLSSLARHESLKISNIFIQGKYQNQNDQSKCYFSGILIVNIIVNIKFIKLFSKFDLYELLTKIQLDM